MNTARLTAGYACGLSVEKPLSLSKNGVWGVAPRQVAGTPVPVFTPFPGKGGRGIGIINQKFISKTDFFYNLTAGIACGFFLSTLR